MEEEEERWWSAAGDREAKGIAIYAALSIYLASLSPLSAACGCGWLVCLPPPGLASLLMCRAFAFYPLLACCLCLFPPSLACSGAVRVGGGSICLTG
jgi:hypothetical protein